MSDTNIFPIEESLVSRSRKERSFGVKSCTFWFCGLSGSGKSTLAIALEEFLFSKGYPSVVLDGDNLRKGLCQNLGFTLEDRRENVRRASEIAKILVNNGNIAIVSMISPTADIRNLARQTIGEDDYCEIFVKSSFEKCKERDVKGLYAKSDQGVLSSLTGKDSSFEIPKDPWLVIDTELDKKEESMTKLFDAVLVKIQ